MQQLTPHQKKALNYKEHISLTANAGSGKTFVLSKRFVEIALNEKISLRNIAAITFTEKAAGDLYKKIAKEIDQQITEETDYERKRSLERIRRELVSANISTIHSFCIDILREFPIESNIDANFTPIDESFAKDMIEYIVDEVLKEFIASESGSDTVKTLIRLFGSKSRLADELIALIQNKKNVINLKSLIYDKTDEEIADFFFSSFNSLCRSTILANAAKVIESVSRINNAALSENPANEFALLIQNSLSALNGQNELEVFAEIAPNILTTSNTIRKRNYLKNQSGLSEEILIVEKNLPLMASSAVPANHQEIEMELARTGKKILVLFDAVLQKYDQKKSEGGYLDFEDILLVTQKILLNEDVREKLSEKYKYLMIDEYQDTNEIQYNIFLPILDNLQRNNLFVVGDEKQSIYMFRDAELEIFNKTKQDIRNKNGETGILYLPDSFRMAPEICLFTNYLFKNLFSNANSAYNEVQPNDLVCGRNDGVKGYIEFLISNKSKECEHPSPDLTELIALRINELVNNPDENIKLKYSDIAILCRKRKSFTELEKIFSRYDIPYSILGGKGFYQKQLVSDFYNYFAFLLNPQNDAAFAGILRSPFFSIDDSALYSVSLENGSSFYEKAIAYSKKHSELKKTIEQVTENISLKETLDITSLFRKIIGETNYLAVISSRKNGDAEVQNLNKLLSISISFFEDGFKSLYDYVSFLRDSIEFSQDEGQAEAFSGDNSVKIMTIHQSKGLEFEAVFLYRCDEKTQKSLVKSKSVLCNKKFGLLTKVPLNSKYFEDYYSAPIVNLANHIVERKEFAEMKRLFYVAVTRAKTYLFVTSLYNGNSFQEGSMMQCLQDALEIDFFQAQYTIKTELSYLKNDNGNYFNETVPVTLDIPIITDVKYRYKKETEKDTTRKELNVFSETIKDIPSDEIFSATKISAYMACPLKYRLNYDFNLNPLFKDYLTWYKANNKKNWYTPREEIEFSKIPELFNEEAVNYYPELRGKIIHSVLQNGVKKDELETYVRKALSEELTAVNKPEKDNESFVKSVIEYSESFIDSPVFREINGYANYYNEFELFLKENDFILHGIIDKLIIDGDTVLIIDFKTDNIPEEKLEERFASYLTQLKFYSYIAYKHFKHFKKFVVRVIFIKYPEKIFTKTIDSEEFPLFGRIFFDTVRKIRDQEFGKNTKHCPECVFSGIGNKCIINN